MPRESTIVGLIPARGGSKGIPRKNIKLLAGKPLLAHCIEQARQTQHVKETYVSTEDREVAGIAEKFGARVFAQPPEISTDTSSSELALLNFARQVDFDVLVFLQCTSPLTLAEDIDGAVVKFVDEKFDSVLSVCEDHGGFLCGGFLWNARGQSVNYDYRKRPRRQERPPIYRENGAVYVMTKEGLLRHQNRLHGRIGLYVMPRERSFEVDELKDWEMAEHLMRMRANNPSTFDARA